MKRVAITGAGGFVGANLARRLVAEGHETHVLARRPRESWRLADISGDLRWHEAALQDAAGVHAAVESIRPDWVFHLAAYGAYSSQTGIRPLLETNVEGTVNLMESCVAAGFEALVNAGSSSEYGYQDHAPAEEEMIRPNSRYAVTKAFATHYGQFLAASHGARIVTLRLYSVYGPWEEPTRLIPTLLLRALESRLPRLVAPEIARDFVFTDDVVDAFLRAAEGAAPGSVFNVGTGMQTAMRELVELVRRMFGVTEEPQWGSMPDRSWDTATWSADSRKIRDCLGWQPRIDLREGLRRTMEWLRSDAQLLALYRERREEPR